MNSEKKQKRRFKPFHYVPLSHLPFRYLPPNFATATSMVIGFLSIIFSIKGEFETAGWLVILCVFLDGIDGMLARLLKAQSHFGIEFDSFSDFVSFGIAPPAIMLSYIVYGDFVTENVGHLMWIPICAAIFYSLMASIRLARFNVQTVSLGDKIFQGIPTTACAGILSAFFLTLVKYGNPLREPVHIITLCTSIYTIFGFLMVSRIPLLKLRKRKNIYVNTFERGLMLLCLLLAIARMLPDFLLAVGIINISMGIYFGVKVQNAQKRERELSILSKRNTDEEKAEEGHKKPARN